MCTGVLSGFTVKLFKVYCCSPTPLLLSLQACGPQHSLCSYKIEEISIIDGHNTYPASFKNWTVCIFLK